MNPKNLGQAWLALLILCCLCLPARAGECDCATGQAEDNPVGDWTLTFGYERMDMGTLLRGSTRVSPEQAALDGLAANGSPMFSVPTWMLMERYLLRARYSLDERQSIALTIPQVVNQMDMLMAMAPMPAAPGMGMGMGMGMAPMPAAGPTFSAMTMDPVNQLGDIALHYSYDVIDESDGRLTLGVGIKTPTGDSQVRDARGRLIHAMMQPGTGSWDAVLTASGRVELDETWAIEPGLSYQITGRNELGYSFGNRLGYDLGVRCQVVDPLTLRLDLNGVVTGRDSTDGTIDPVTGTVAYQRPTTSLIDNVQNSGISSLYISPGLSWKIADEVSLTVQHRIPIARSVNGTQLVTDGWTLIHLNGSF
ncbi:hypothetical protein DYH09_26930 [bacterium CPR1]|nr:hypothetical protein [bacterium CPR1]